ncbi:MAG: hypothetical protein JST53_05265 [Actinobacteria bacterium]|nr:hypothetical protein [Actinomycetota bacterium]
MGRRSRCGRDRSEECGARTVEAWIAAWAGGAAIAVANGAARETTYGRTLPERAANQISVSTGSAAFLAAGPELARRRSGR